MSEVPPDHPWNPPRQCPSSYERKADTRPSRSTGHGCRTTRDCTPMVIPFNLALEGGLLHPSPHRQRGEERKPEAAYPTHRLA